MQAFGAKISFLSVSRTEPLFSNFNNLSSKHAPFYLFCQVVQSAARFFGKFSSRLTFVQNFAEHLAQYVLLVFRDAVLRQAPVENRHFVEVFQRFAFVKERGV